MAAESRYRLIAMTLWLAFGILALAACLILLAADVATYRTLQKVTVHVQELHISTETTALEDVGPAIQIHTEMTLSTPHGLRLVSGSTLLRPEKAREKVAELEALRDRTVEMFLSSQAPYGFALTRSFDPRGLIALAFVLLLLIFPPVLGLWDLSRSAEGTPAD